MNKATNKKRDKVITREIYRLFWRAFWQDPFNHTKLWSHQSGGYVGVPENGKSAEQQAEQSD